VRTRPGESKAEGGWSATRCASQCVTSRRRGGDHGVWGRLRPARNNLAPEPCGSGAKKWEWAFATRSFPAAHAWARSLSRVVCFPTPLSAACGCLGLMAGPSRLLPIGICRVRPLRPVRSLPAGGGTPDVVRTRLQLSFSRVGTVATGTAPAGGWPLAPRYGSDLLPLRLLLLLQRGDAVFHAAPMEEVSRTLPGSLAPRRRAALARPARVTEPGLLAGWARRAARLRSGLRSSNQNPLGNCVGARVETSCGPDSARARFLIAPCRSVHFFVFLADRTRLRPEELVRYASRPACAVARGGRHQLQPSISRSPGIIPAVLSVTISDLPRCDCSIKERVGVCASC
jgi:hypothetical protein